MRRVGAHPPLGTYIATKGVATYAPAPFSSSFAGRRPMRTARRNRSALPCSAKAFIIPPQTARISLCGGFLVKLVYSDRYDLNLGNHVFPSIKYRLVKEKLLHDGISSARRTSSSLPRPRTTISPWFTTGSTCASCKRASSPTWKSCAWRFPILPNWSGPCGCARAGQFWPDVWRSRMEWGSMWAADFTTPSLTTAKASAC